MEMGTIKRIDYDRGFGFIEPDDRRNRRDVHFAPRAVQRPIRFDDLNVGQRVQFERRANERGWTATTVQVIIEAAPQPRSADVSIRDPGPGDRFFNPYNFVRYLPPGRETNDPNTRLLGRCLPPPQDRWVGLSGRICCRLTTVTPLFISDSEGIELDAEVEEHKRYRFYRWQGEKAIPAASLRGPIRTVFEAITNSCFATLTDRRLSYRLTGREIRSLVPARIEPPGQDRDGHQRWKLRLLTGASLLRYDRPPDGLYASGVRRYGALRATGRRHSNPPPLADTNEVKHGEECWAVLMEIGFPPSWRVLVLRHTREEAEAELKALQSKRPISSRLTIERGWYCHTNQNAENKHSERFFYPRSSSGDWPEEIDLPDHVRQNYEALIADYQDRHAADVKARKKPDEVEIVERNGNLENHVAYSRFILNRSERRVGGGELVYARLHGRPPNLGVKFIAPVSWPRVAYEHTIAQLLRPPFQPSHHCSDEKLCPACRTFGWVHGGGEGAYRGRVRFSHAELKQHGTDVGEVRLAILSSPKPTTARFYLTGPDGQPHDGRLDEEVGYDGNNGQNLLRGRKIYRHFTPVKEAITSEDRSDQNRTVIDPEGRGAVFEFRVDFENMAEVELGAFLWALTLGGRAYHRLGYAKPLGFGSAIIDVMEVRTLDPQGRYTSLTDPGYAAVSGERIAHWTTTFQQAAQVRWDKPFDELAPVVDLLALTGRSEPRLPVHYPTSPDPTSKGQFEWFTGNKREGNRGPKLELGLAVDDKGLPLISKDGKISP